MTSTLWESEEHDQGYRYGKVKVTILASEWGSSKGGLSTINRELAIQLAKFPEVEITFFLPKCSEQDKKEALSHKINIVEAKRRPGFEELEWLSFPPEHLQIDVIVGHGVKLGRQAQIIRDSHKCKWVQVVHTDPEELGMFKSYSNPISKGQEKHKIEVELCEMANCVIGVGPKLTEAFCSYLRGCHKHQTVFDFTPGVFDEFFTVRQVPEEKKRFCILVFGRGDAEDFELKGFDIAGKAVASLPDTYLVFVGAPSGQHEDTAKRLLHCGISASCLKVRGYVESRESLKDLFCEVDMVLMPSRTEGFGLTGLEALSAGLPVLASKNSGFGEALRKVPFGSSFVIHSEDPKVWAAVIKDIKDKDRESRLEEADVLRSFYKKKYSWAKQSKDLLEKMISMVHDSSSTCQNSTHSAGELSSPPSQISQRTDVTTEHHTDQPSTLLPDGVLKQALEAKDEQIKMLQQQFREFGRFLVTHMQQLAGEAATSSKTETVSFRDFQIGDLILLVFDERCEKYLALTTEETPFFLHDDSMAGLDLATSGSTRRPWMLAQVTDREYCMAKKPNNRFRIPAGTKFYRIRAEPCER